MTSQQNSSLGLILIERLSVSACALLANTSG